MNRIMKQAKPALVSFLTMTIICGVIYTFAITGLVQLLFPSQANGSMITVKTSDGNERIYGSTLIAQQFTKPEYLIGRPLGVTNLSPVSKEQREKVAERIDWWQKFDSTNTAEIPMELVTASGSGVDPYITPEGAAYQIKRIAVARNMDEAEVKAIVEKYTTPRLLGVLGEPVVSVLKVNLALDGKL